VGFVPSSQPDVANDVQVPLGQIGIFGAGPLDNTGFNSAHPPGHTAELTGKRDPVINSMSVSLLSGAGVSGSFQSKPIRSTSFSTSAGYPVQVVGDLIGGVPSNSASIFSQERKSSQGVKSVPADVSAISNVSSVIGSESKSARKNLLLEFNRSPLTHASVDASRPLQSDPTMPLGQSVVDMEEVKDGDDRSHSLDLSDVHESREQEQQRYKRATSWVNDRGLSIPNLHQLKMTAKKEWLAEKPMLPSVESQHDLVLRALEKICKRSLSSFGVEGRILKKTGKRGNVSVAVFVRSSQLCKELQELLQSVNVESAPLVPSFVELECVLPPGVTDARIASVIADNDLYGMILFKRLTSPFFPKGSSRFFVPFNLFNSLYKFGQGLGVKLSWQKVMYNSSVCCNKCWQVGHSGKNCSNPRRCFRCAGSCVGDCSSASANCGLCRGDHIAPHCRKFYVRKRVPILIPTAQVSAVVSAPSPTQPVSLTHAQSRPSAVEQEVARTIELIELVVQVLRVMFPHLPVPSAQQIQSLLQHPPVASAAAVPASVPSASVPVSASVLASVPASVPVSPPVRAPVSAIQPVSPVSASQPVEAPFRVASQRRKRKKKAGSSSTTTTTNNNNNNNNNNINSNNKPTESKEEDVPMSSLASLPPPAPAAPQSLEKRRTNCVKLLKPVWKKLLSVAKIQEHEQSPAVRYLAMQVVDNWTTLTAQVKASMTDDEGALFSFFLSAAEQEHRVVLKKVKNVHLKKALSECRVQLHSLLISID
jgi:hypothetical protein